MRVFYRVIARLQSSVYDAGMIAPFGSWKSPVTTDLIVAESVNLKELTLDGDFSGCQVVFFQTQDKSELAKILKKVAGQPILTVSDCTGFAGFGVMLNFYTEAEGGKVKFEVNSLAVSDAKLKISSSLLKLARVL